MSHQTTYAEAQGAKPFDWWAALNDPPEAGSIEHGDLCDLSEEWVTCACGNQCDIIPRDNVGAPYDYRLDILGRNFHGCVKVANWQSAKATLSKIEARSAELIAEIGGEETK